MRYRATGVTRASGQDRHANVNRLAILTLRHANKRSKRPATKTPKRRNGDSSLGTTDEHERNKDFLSEQEVEMLRKEARGGRYGERDDCLILMLYRHGLRASEAAELRIKDLDLKTSRLWVGRLKGSLSTHQPIEGDELRVIKRYLATRDDDLPWLFITERHGQLTRSGIFWLPIWVGSKRYPGLTPSAPSPG